MVRTYFGKPGAGKTTALARVAYKTSKAIDRGKSKYSIIVGNVSLKGIPHYYKISFATLGLIGYPDALILIDEASIEADSRNWGATSKQFIEFLLIHRHWQNDIYFFSQIWNRIDKTIRDITEECVYLHKGLIFRGFTRETIIRYGIMIPQCGEDHPGEIIMGYLKPTKVAQVFESRFWRRPYYKYFDTLERPDLPLFKCEEYGNALPSPSGNNTGADCA